MKKMIYFITVMIGLPIFSIAQPYTPFPKDYLSWQLWGESYEYMAHRLIYSIDGEEITIDGKNYTLLSQASVAGIREENKQIFVYIPEYGEHLLYDFNLEIGDTIFYDIGLAAQWKTNLYLNWFPDKNHYAIVTEKGEITLENGDIRNTIILEKHTAMLENEMVVWVEGIGATSGIGLLDPLVTTYVLDGTSIQLICVCGSKNSDGCLLDLDCGTLEIACHCETGSSIIENEASKINIFPNPSEDFFNIETIESVNIKSIAIYSMDGKRVEMKTYAVNPTQIAVNQLKAGSYIVIIETDKGKFNKTIIKN